jgi:hypothetical protein
VDPRRLHSQERWLKWKIQSQLRMNVKD